MAEFKDFDEALAEDADLKITFKVGGRNYEAPTSLPAKVVLAQLKLSNDEGGIDQRNIGEWLGAVMGEMQFTQMLDDGISWIQLEKVLIFLLVQYGIIPDPDAEVSDAEGGEEEDPK